MLRALSLHSGMPDIIRAEGGEGGKGRSVVAAMASVASFALLDAPKLCVREGGRSGTGEQRLVRHRI